METYELEIDVQTVLMLVEAVAYLALAGWALARRPQGGWAALLALGAGLVGLALGIAAVGTAELVFLDSAHVLEAVLIREHVQTLFTVARVAGVLLLVGAVVESRRTPPAAPPTTSIYGPG